MTLRQDTKRHLEVWQEFLDKLQPSEVPRFPIWAMEFGADYPFEGKAPNQITKSRFRREKRNFWKENKR